ncbi:hypothetical protein K4F52_008305 [Lecanicillium sp. MT-2017a]|nr:hypothetical protein K4F52_008305 [Lecanicillium sp. MT-2017a]
MDLESQARHHSQPSRSGEDQPFLASSAASSSARRPRHHNGSVRPGMARRTPCWQLTVFFVFLVITVFGLALVPFSFKLDAGPPSPDQLSSHHDDHQHSHDDQQHPEEQPPPASAPTPEPDQQTVQSVTTTITAPSPDTQPTDVPRLRDASEYILNPSWDHHAAPTTREYNWTISNADLNPDGVYRPMYLINNQFPGPLVECNAGDTIIVHVHNRAVNATAIHFHGLFQNGTNAMDGTVGVTQCAIAPDSSFTYTFQITGQSGTYWYHAHHSAQASDGLLGPVVVHAQDERTTLQERDYASDRVIMVQDHYHNLTSEILMEYLQPDMENDEPVPDNALVNGRGQRNCDDFPGWRCDNSTTAAPVLDLEPNKRHRLRFINVGTFAEFQIQLDEHPFYVTEVDGTDVHPEPFHRLNILPAQRYSIIVETNVTTADSFWMRARMVTHCFTTDNPRLEPEIRSIIRYANSTSSSPVSHIAPPTSKEWPDAIEVICRDLDTSALHPVVHQSPPPLDDFIILRANFEIGDWRLARGFFNTSTWHPNATHPSLHRYLDSPPSSASSSNESAFINTNNSPFDPASDYVLQTRSIRTVDISINNFDDGSHPFHLHGHKFFVLQQGQSGYPPFDDEWRATLAEKPHLTENPLRRDTITVEGYGWAVIRVVLDNPGLWAFHCHNTWHAESGMVMQFLVRSDDVKTWEVDDRMRAMCDLPGVEKGMKPDDGIWFGNFD